MHGVTFTLCRPLSHPFRTPRGAQKHNPYFAHSFPLMVERRRIVTDLVSVLLAKTRLRRCSRFSTATVPHRIKPRASIVFYSTPASTAPPFSPTLLLAIPRYCTSVTMRQHPPDSCKRPQCHLLVVLTLSSFFVFDARSLCSERALSVSWFSSMDLLRF